MDLSKLHLFSRKSCQANVLPAMFCSVSALCTCPNVIALSSIRRKHLTSSGHVFAMRWWYVVVSAEYKRLPAKHPMFHVAGHIARVHYFYSVQSRPCIFAHLSAEQKKERKDRSNC